MNHDTRDRDPIGMKARQIVATGAKLVAFTVSLPPWFIGVYIAFIVVGIPPGAAGGAIAVSVFCTFSSLVMLMIGLVFSGTLRHPLDFLTIASNILFWVALFWGFFR